MKKLLIRVCFFLLLAANVVALHFCLLATNEHYQIFTEQVKLKFQPAKVKIFMTYYKPFQLPKKGKIIQPMQVGRAIENEAFMGGSLSEEDIKWLHQNTIGDDLGDNISDKNRSFDVLTAFYWVWKHYKEIGNPQYIGFWAHSKILIVTPKKMRKFNRNAPDYGIDEDELIKLLDKHKVITWYWTPYIYHDGKNSSATAYENYRVEHQIEDLEEMVRVINEKYPEMNAVINEVLYDVKPQPIWNYFIMTRELAADYFSKLFAVMFELEKRIGTEVNQRDYKQRRAFGYLAERFFAVWLTYQTEKGLVSPLFVPQQYL